MNAILMITLLSIIVVHAHSADPQYTWRKMKSAQEVAALPTTLSLSAHDQRRGIVYVLNTSGFTKELFTLDLSSLAINRVETSGSLPERVDMYTLDPRGNNIIAGRSGRDVLYSLALDGTRTWTQTHNGSLDAESYGTNLFWNTSSSRPSMFGGYGYFRVKNWVWEAESTGWTNVVPDNDRCEPQRRVNQNRMMLGDPSRGEIFFYSGEGSCSGVQFGQPRGCPEGKTWNTAEPNSYCWLRDIWRYEYSSRTFSNILPASSESYQYEGSIGYNYTTKTFVLLPMFHPPTFTSQTKLEALSSIMILEPGSKEFRTISVGGDVPPQSTMDIVKNMTTYYDDRYNRFVVIRGDGIWFLEQRAAAPQTCDQQVKIDSVIINTRQNQLWKSVPTEKGKMYLLRGSGTWNWNNGNTQIADFRYYITLPCDSATAGESMFVGVGLNEEATKRRTGLLEPVRASIDCKDHVYEYLFEGTGEPVVVDFFDNFLGDNSGNLTVNLFECLTCSASQPSDSILGYRTTETHQVVTYALRNKPELSYQWIATGGYVLGETTKHYCDVIWGYDNTGSVCCIVSDSTCTDTICVDVAINNATTGGIAGDAPTEPTMSARPNPTSDMIDISSVDATDSTSYTLVDVTGRVLQQVHGQRVRMSVEDVPSGVYHLLMKNAEGTVVAMQRVVVQK